MKIMRLLSWPLGILALILMVPINIAIILWMLVTGNRAAMNIPLGGDNVTKNRRPR